MKCNPCKQCGSDHILVIPHRDNQTVTVMCDRCNSSVKYRDEKNYAGIDDRDLLKKAVELWNTKNFVKEQKHQIGTIHTLKTVEPYFSAVKIGIKKFEVRKNDRDFKVGDTLVLQEYPHTGEEVVAAIIYILDDPQYCKDGYVILGFVTL